MIHSKLNKPDLFLPDDFFKVDQKYFKLLRDKKEIEADPSYWFDSDSPIDISCQGYDLKTYRIDFNHSLENEKVRLIETISSWDSQQYTYDDLTICNSSTSASYIILGFLKERIDTLFIETPAYYATIEQSQMLGIKVVKIPTYISNGFQINAEFFNSLHNAKGKIGIWISQPRFGLGLNQPHEGLTLLLSFLRDDDFLIVDEATEQLFPSHLSEFNFKKRKNILKYRSFMKPLGFNGPRLAYILHHSDYRNLIQCHMEITQGAIDCFSLAYVTKILSNKEEFERILKAANKYVNNLRSKMESLVRGTNLKVIPLENGYIGSVAYYYDQEGDPSRLRKQLLSYCKHVKCPIILGSGLYFAIDPRYEFIRINYFNTEYNVMTGIQLILKFRPFYRECQ
jgi:aspartate/methionine/tyrosine aminotransferase